MRRARLIAVALIASARAVCAQPVGWDGGELSLCLQAARVADDDCAKLTDDPAGRIACFQKARGAELECLEHALSNASAAAPEQETPAASASSLPEQPTVAAAPDPSGNTTESPKGEAAMSPPEPPKTDAAASLPEQPTGSVSANASEEKDLLGKDHDAAPPANPDPVRAIEAPAPAASASASVEVAQPREPDTATLRGSSWVVSETTSPIDYSPQIAAVLRPASRLHDGPSSLAVRCRRGRTEMSVWSEAGWRPMRSDAVLVDHRINREPIVRLTWSLSADARTATYKEDVVELLRSLPEGGLLSISIPDGDNPRREATFLLTGWTAIRQKIEKLCKWPPAGRVTYGRR
jgi:hypothetical protein